MGEACHTVLKTGYFLHLGWVHCGLLKTGEVRERFALERKQERSEASTGVEEQISIVHRVYNHCDTYFNLTLRIFPNPEVISSPVGLVPPNALVLTSLANF